MEPRIIPNRVLRNLEVLRGVLATYVVLGHARWLLWAGQAEWMRESHPWYANALAYAGGVFRWGHEAVIVFFVLSGFFIHLRFAQQLPASQQAPFDVQTFFRRRAQRLIPPYAFALVLTLIADSIGTHFFPALYQGRSGDGLLDENFRNMGYSAESVLPALGLLPSSLGRHFGSNGPLWSLAFEMVYYLAYPIWLLLRRFGVWWGYGALAFLCVLGASATGWPFLKVVLLSYPAWIAGAALAEALSKGAGCASFKAFYALGSMTLAAMLVNWPSYRSFAFCPLWGTLVVWSFCQIPQWMGATRLFSLLEALGLRSYSVYVCHFPLLVLISAGVFEIGGRRPLGGWLALGGSLATLSLCLLCFAACERHFLHGRIRRGSAEFPQVSE